LVDKDGKLLEYTNAFVDNQGKGQGWVATKDETAVPNMPYYCSSPYSYGLTKTNNSDGTSNFEITDEDEPDGVEVFQSIRFETYVVVTNYNGKIPIGLLE
jgi:hypothetical protein